MSHNIDSKLVGFKPFHYEASEKAQKVRDQKGRTISKGHKKGRLHLTSYGGKKGKDLNAVAAEIMDFKGKPPKLGWLDRKYNVLVELPSEDGETTTWYKINKNSLNKRLDISVKDLEIDKKTGVIGKKLQELAEAKQKNLDSLIDRTYAFKNAFESMFIQKLAEAGLSGVLYADIDFFPFKEGCTIEIDDDRKEKYNKLFPRSCVAISYTEDGSTRTVGPDFEAMSKRDNSPVIDLVIDRSSYKKILSGKPIPQSILDQLTGPLNQPLNLPQGKLEIEYQNETYKYNFDSNTRPIDLQKWVDEFYTKGTNVRTQINTGNPDESIQMEYKHKITIPYLVEGIRFSARKIKRDEV